MPQLLDVAIDPKVKLCALWTSAMFCAIYSVLFRLYIPGALEDRISWFGAPGHEGRWMWIAIPILIPVLMIFLSVALPAKYNRILNIVVGVAYVLLWGLGRILNLELASLASRTATTPIPARETAVSLEVVLIVIAALVVWYAWTWPRKPNAV